VLHCAHTPDATCTRNLSTHLTHRSPRFGCAYSRTCETVAVHVEK
jgi:hypothetical protein